MKIYDLVKSLLEENADLRNSDKKLIWRVWDKTGYLHTDNDAVALDFISEEGFMEAPSTESIRRCRQKIQEKYPELRGSEKVTRARKAIADQRGTHVFRETVGGQLQAL